MQTETAIAAKLAAKGVLAHEVRFKIALAEFQNNGGSFERAMSLTMAAYGKRSEGQMQTYFTGHDARADASLASLQNDGAGQLSLAEKAKLEVPSPSAQRNGAGQHSLSDKAKLAVPRPVSPAYIEAAKAGAKKMALTVMDSFKVRDGRAIGDLIFGELEGLRIDNAMEASIIRQIQRHAANVPSNAKVRDVIKADELERIIQRGAEVADAA